METTVKPKKWGNSIGVIIPKEIVKKEEITLKDELIIHVEKKKDASKKQLMRDGYKEMASDLAKINKEWSKADSRWPRK